MPLTAQRRTRPPSKARSSIDRVHRIIECSILSLLLAFSAARVLGQCAGKVSSPAAAADCAARETPREGTAILDPLHPYTLAELIDVAEHHNPSTRTIWERAKQKARELGLAKSAYYPELEGLAVFGDQRSIDPSRNRSLLAATPWSRYPSSSLKSRSNISSLTLVNARRAWTPRKRRSSPRGCRRHSGKSSAGVSRRQCVLPAGDCDDARGLDRLHSIPK